MPYVSNGIYYVASGDSEFGNIPRGSNGAYSNGSMYKTEVVNSGGAIYNQNILDSGSVIVSSGGRTFGLISIASGGKVEYANGSITSATVGVSSGGSLIIDPGAQQYVGDNYVLHGGTVTFYRDPGKITPTSDGGTIIFSAGTSPYSADFSSVTFPSGNTKIIVNSGATIQNVNLLSGNTLTVDSAGKSIGAVISSGGSLTFTGGGSGSYTSLLAGGTLNIGSGTTYDNQHTTSLTATSGAQINVLSGGVLTNADAGNGGTITVSSGGKSTSTVISSGGTLTFTGGGSGSYTSLLAGGTLNIGSGTTYDNQHTTSLTATSGAQINVLSGGVLTNADAGNGGTITVSSGGKSTSTVISSGGTLTFTGGGSGSYTSLLAGGTLNIGSGTTYDNQHTTSLTATSGAQINVLSGGVLTNADAAAFGNIVVSKGGMGQDIIISSGGGLWVAGIASDTSVNNGGGIAIASGGVSNNNNVNSGGKIYADSGSVLGLTSVSSGGSAIVASGATISDVVTIQDGGTATIWNNTSGTIDLSGDTNNGLTISGLESGGTVSTVISGWSGSKPGNSDSIDLPGVSADGASYAYPSDDQVVVTLANGNTITLNIPGVKNTGFVLSDDGHGGASAEVCFLSGSMIDTPKGDVPVENIRMGDTVIAYVHGVSQETTVTWAGTARAAVRSHLRDDEAGYPVRILKDAVSDGVPYKDMLITPEHCLFFDGRFIPARMLINGSSIFYDKSITTYDYYHIETEHHAVIKADGMLTESYLDTGNRRAFIQEGNLVSLRNTNQNWENDAAVPLCVERSFVEPVFRTLQARSVKLFGEQDSVTTAQLTHNPDLHLVTENGASVRPVRQEENVYSFMLPPGTTSVRIVSRTARPSDIIGPFVDDRRELGVAIGTISLITAHQKQSVFTHLETEKPDGWYPENGERSIAWTNGNAFLPLEERAFPHQILLLSLTVLAAGPYLFEENTHTTPDMQKQSA